MRLITFHSAGLVVSLNNGKSIDTMRATGTKFSLCANMYSPMQGILIMKHARAALCPKRMHYFHLDYAPSDH